MKPRSTSARPRLLALCSLLAALPCQPAGAASPDFADPPTSKPDTLTVTWHADPLTTMTVQWLGDLVIGDTPPGPGDARPDVWYAPAGRDDWKRVQAEAKPWPLRDVPEYVSDKARLAMPLWRAHIEGLQPGASYRLRIGTQSPEYRFRTAPADNRAPVTFVSGGDVSSGSAAVKTHQAAARQNPLFALIGGDLGYSDGHRTEREIAFLREWHQHMVTPDGHLIPLLAGIGNHEVTGGSNFQQRAPFFAALFDGLYPGGRTYATVDFAKYLSLVILDTDHIQPVAGEQTAWLDRALDQRSAFPHRLVFYHVPGWPSHRDFNGRTEGEVRKHWAPLLEKHRVPVAFEHHDHTYKRTHPLRGGKVAPDAGEGVVYMGDGAWGVGLRPVKSPADTWYLAKSASVHHFIRHTIHEGRSEHVVIGHEGKEIDRLSLPR